MARSEMQKAHINALNAARAASTAASASDGHGECRIQLAIKDSKIAHLEKQLEELQEKSDTKEKRIRAKCKQLSRIKERKNTLHTNIKQLRLRIKNRDARKKGKAKRERLEKEEGMERPILGSVSLKEKGVFTVDARSMVRQLANESVSEAKVDAVIHVVAKCLGVEVEDHIDPRSVRRMVAEAGIAAEIQLVDELKPENCEGYTISCDGTTIRHRTYESRHITTKVPDYNAGDGAKTTKTRVYSITNAVNHKSDTQIEGLKTVTSSYYKTYNASPLGKGNPVDSDTFFALMDGAGADHATDMQRFAKLCEFLKIESKKILQGKELWSQQSDLETIAMLAKAGKEAVEKLGGLAAWDKLSQAEQAKIDEKTLRTVWTSIGGKAWDEMSAEEKELAGRFVYAGCCMHKDLNSVKGGTEALEAFWSTIPPHQRPVKLMNASLASVAKAGAEEQAENLAVGGATKLTSLAGMVFKHKDPKKGQQDFYKSFFEKKLGYTWRFPDTSNTRFQSHCAASAELIVHLPLYLEFLLLVRDRKNTRSFSNIEANVFKGLKDVATVTDMSVYAFYDESLSKKYMNQVRQGGERRANALDLGPLHERVKEHCKKIIADPDLLLRGEEGDYTEGTLDGTMWDRPDVIYAIQRLSPSLPHLADCIRAFFAGALKTWERLTSEYAPGGTISRLNVAERDRIFINPTNDHNEGALGTTRLALRRAPNTATRTISAKTMYARNETESFIQTKLTEKDDWSFVMKEARRRDADGQNKRQREEEIAHETERVETKRRAVEQAAQKLKEKQDRITQLTPELDLAILQKNVKQFRGSLTVPNLKDQLEWHRRINPDIVLAAKLIRPMNRGELLQQLTTAVQIYHKRERTSSASAVAVALPSQVEEGLVEMSWEEREDALDEALETMECDD